MNFLNNSLVTKLLLTLLYSISPIILSMLQDTVEKLRVAAQESANPWDDILVEIIDNILRQIAPPKQ